jgi:hypothetical protein
MNFKSPNNTSKWQMGFNSAFKGLNRFSEHREVQARSGKANAHKAASFICAVNIGNVPVCVLYLIQSRSVRVITFYVEQKVFICNKLAKYVSWGKKCSMEVLFKPLVKNTVYKTEVQKRG